MIKASFLDLVKKPLVLWILLIIFLLMWFEIFYFTKENNVLYALLSLAWYWTSKRFKVSYVIALMAGLGFLLFVPILMLFKEYLAMKVGVWAFLLLLDAVLLKRPEEK